MCKGIVYEVLVGVGYEVQVRRLRAAMIATSFDPKREPVVIEEPEKALRLREELSARCLSAAKSKCCEVLSAANIDCF